MLQVEWLRELAIVDTPGTNAIVLAHEALTKRIVPRADLVTLSPFPAAPNKRPFHAPFRLAQRLFFFFFFFYFYFSFPSLLVLLCAEENLVKIGLSF